ncbi:protein PHYTOCHROME KINASE SUBSTRATE 3-like [Henckelia pumila]|uniref:protein PHYTOCHROME KINASE SUBSTRATE 3-like n=1 Tax=Henckelia pumila TaxID=405737 RepID=UPI003C6E215E
MENHEDNTSLRVASFSCYLDRDKENLIRRISAQETPSLVMSSGKSKSSSIKSPFHANLPHSKDTQDHGLKNARSDSFSYLNASGENFVFKVPGPIQDPISAFTFSQDHHPKDGEISVFGADRYFNMKLEYASGLKREFNKNRPVNLPRISSNGVQETRSLASETNSWTSQTAMMKSLRRNDSQTKPKKSNSWRIFPGFGCQVPCFDKKNVKINDKIIPHDITYKSSKASRAGSDRISGHHLTTIPDQESHKNFIVDKIKIEEEKLEEARNSIEVFGSSISSKGDIATNLERKLSMLTWDAIPEGKSHQNSIPAASTIGTSTIICDDMASDASSDLFEIENISGCINQILSSKTDNNQDDVVSCCMSPISHYAPSEASIQWSVVTASAADYSSILSDTEERCVSISGDMVSRNRNGGGKEAQKIRAGGLLGCKSQKSVDVADQTVCLKALEKVKD